MPDLLSAEGRRTDETVSPDFSVLSKPTRQFDCDGNFSLAAHTDALLFAFSAPSGLQFLEAACMEREEADGRPSLPVPEPRLQLAATGRQPDLLESF